jgi:hypothetical protein
MFRKYLFTLDLDPELEDTLKKRKIPEKLKDKLEKKGFLLPENPDLTQKEVDKWVIIEKKKKKLKENHYILRKERKELRVYKVPSLPPLSDEFFRWHPTYEGDNNLQFIKQFLKKHGKKYEREIESLCFCRDMEKDLDDKDLALNVAYYTISKTHKDKEFNGMLKEWEGNGLNISIEKEAIYRFYFGVIAIEDC